MAEGAALRVDDDDDVVVGVGAVFISVRPLSDDVAVRLRMYNAAPTTAATTIATTTSVMPMMAPASRPVPPSLVGVSI